MDKSKIRLIQILKNLLFRIFNKIYLILGLNLFKLKTCINYCNFKKIRYLTLFIFIVQTMP